MKYIDHQVPRLDLAWAHQCIIQRRRLPLRGEPRYSVSLEGSFHDSGQIFSFKSKAGNRYGVGDLVQISRGQKSTSKGRILSITWKRHEMECQFEVQLLVRFVSFIRRPFDMPKLCPRSTLLPLSYVVVRKTEEIMSLLTVHLPLKFPLTRNVFKGTL